MRMPEKVRVDDAATHCLTDCSDCNAICLQTIQHCLTAGGELADERLIAILTDCAQVCETAKAFLLRSSSASGAVCAACAEVAERCAQACDRFPDDSQMRVCAEICRATAAACLRMASTQP